MVLPLTSILQLFRQSSLKFSLTGSDMTSAKLLKTYEEHHKRIESIKLDISDPDQGQGVMISSGKDGLIKYWSIADDKSLQTFKGSQEQITCVTFDKLRIVMASRENKIKIFDFSPNI